MAYQDITWLAGRAFLQRAFVTTADERGLAKIFATCPYGDLTAEQQATFAAAFHHPRLRQLVVEWWQAYDAARAAGEIPATEPWEP